MACSAGCPKELESHVTLSCTIPKSPRVSSAVRIVKDYECLTSSEHTLSVGHDPHSRQQIGRDAMQRVLIAVPRLAGSCERPGIPEPILCGCPKARRQRDGDAGRDRRTPRSRALAGRRRFPHLQPNGKTTAPNSPRRASIWFDSHHFPDAGGSLSSRKCATAHATAYLFKKLELQVSLGVTGAASEEMARYRGAAS